MPTQNTFVPRPGMWVEYDVEEGHSALSDQIVAVGCYSATDSNDHHCIQIWCEKQDGYYKDEDFLIYSDQNTGVPVKLLRRDGGGRDEKHAKKLVIGFGPQILHTYEVGK